MRTSKALLPIFLATLFTLIGAFEVTALDDTPLALPAAGPDRVYRKMKEVDGKPKSEKKDGTGGSSGTAARNPTDIEPDGDGNVDENSTNNSGKEGGISCNTDPTKPNRNDPAWCVKVADLPDGITLGTVADDGHVTLKPSKKMTFEEYNCLLIDDVPWEKYVPTPGGVILGDVNQDTEVNFLDITPFINLLSSGSFLQEADCNEDGAVDFLDITPFLALVSGS
jgi:hypothetical protein